MSEKPKTDRNDKGQFLTGLKRPGPGRPLGSRNKLTEDFLRVLAEDFAKHGTDAVVKARQEKPTEYVKVIAGLMPKNVQIKHESDVARLPDEELARIIAECRSELGYLSATYSQGSKELKH